MTHAARSARVGMTVLTLGFLIAGPHCPGVAVADRGDGGSASDNPGPQRGRAASDSPSPTAAARTSSRSGLSAGTPEPAAARRAGTLVVPNRGTPAPRTADASTSEPSPLRDLTESAPAILQTIPASASQSAPASTAAIRSAPIPTSTDPAVPDQPAASTASLPAVPATVSAVRSAVANLVDASLNWFNGLPGGPVAEALSGALLLVRRDLEQASASAPQRAASSTTLVTTTSVNNTFVVSTLADDGAGSLRQAIIDANAATGADAITFDVAGTIRVASTALPTITGTTVIDGTTAPGYDQAPVVRIDFQNTEGLRLASTANDSEILGLSLVDASGAGLTIAASDTIINGNYIGVREDGRTSEGNRGDGILVTAGADGNIIGNLSLDTFVLSNVISGNRGNGITIEGGEANTVAANYIGTDAGGNRALPNRGNGIQLTGGAAGNLIGGIESGGNDPTEGTFARPPQGNLISGNSGDGVLIDDGATGNQLSGNFIGTGASGNVALGNRGDGVAVVNAHDNGLIGTTSVESPFVFYNVVSGNHGNGLRITDSDHTVVHANFFGIGADNQTIVANWGDGMLVDGDSQFVDAGGEIPLGNVMSGNIGRGIEIAGTSGGVVSFNNFIGQAAFGTQPRPNRSGGILVTSSNPGFDIDNPYTWNKIRTSLIGGNWGDGIAFLGDAHGAEVTDTSVGTDNTIKQALANLGNGIVVAGNASQIAIGGFQPSVEEVDGGFSVYSGANLGFGIVFRGNAHDNTVFNTRVGLGTGVTIGTAAKIPNGLGGILIGWGPSDITIGGLRDALIPGFRYGNQVVDNHGNGILAVSSDGLQVLGNDISGNRGSGIVLNSVKRTIVGEPLSGNTIDENGAYGVFALGELPGGVVQSSTIGGNGLAGVRMAWARGLTVGGKVVPEPNVITNNQGWGILATGWSRGSALSGNFVTDNASGNVNTTFAPGITTL